MPRSPSSARPPRRPLRRLGGLAIALLTSLGLAGCGAQLQPPLVLFIAIGTNRDQLINGQLHDEFQERLQRLELNFRQVHPEVRFRFSIYPETELIAAMRRRQWSGLEPDLLFVNGRTAHHLLQAGITTPFPVRAEMRNRFVAPLLRLVSHTDGTLSGLPVLEQLQVSCYDKRRLPQAPSRIETLMTAKTGGVPVGLSLNPENLMWTVGSLGALPAFTHVVRGEPPRPADLAALRGWLAWLANASGQQRVSFYDQQELAEEGLRQGKLAWIPCRSSTLPQLRHAMGAHLGVAPLPDGDGGEASPVNHIRVLALGSSSTPRARRAAIALSNFTVNPLLQRAMTLGSLTVLPVNRNVAIPAASSTILSSLVRAHDQGLQSEQLLPLLRPGDGRLSQVQELITGLVFGEVSVEAATPSLIAILQKRP